MNQTRSLLVFALFASACASTPAAPFDTLKTSNLVAYRLQNYEPQVATQGPAAGALPFIPPEIQNWAQQAVPALQNLLPPGLLPQGLIPGLPGALPQAAQQAPRFHGFRILEQSAIGDAALKEQLGEMLGDKDHFQPQHAPCMYAEMGLSFANAPGAPTNDVLISFSCNQAQGFNFVWPYPNTGMTPDFVKTLEEIVPKLFAGTTPAPAQPISML